MRVVLLFLAMVCCALQAISAGPYEAFRFRTFSPKGGFYYDGVVDISQDRDGFIWVMLDKDILRFDGYEYRKYTPQFSTQDSTSTWSFLDFARDSAGNLHALTSSAVYRYDIVADKFVRLFDAELENIAIDCNDNIWCLKDNILNRTDSTGAVFTPYSYDNEPVKAIRGYCLGDTKLYFSSHNRIYEADTDRPDRLKLLITLPQDHNIVEIIGDSPDRLWALTSRHGLFCVDTSTGDISRHIDFQNDNDGSSAKTFYIDRNGLIWAGTQQGLYIIDPATGEKKLYRHSKTDPFSLTNNSVWQLFGDAHGNIWIGHFAGGLCYADLDDSLQVSTFTSAMSTLNYELVSSFAEHDGLIYIGMDGGGLNSLDTRTGTISQLRQEGIGNNPLYNHVKSLVVDSLDRLWIAMYRDGLDCLDLNTKRLRHFRRDPSDPAGLRYNDFRKIVLDRDSGLWLAYQNPYTVVSYMSFDDYKCRHFDLGSDNGYVFDIQQDRSGNLYVLTRQKLFRLNVATGAREEIAPGKIADGQSLAIDGAGNVWIGTVGRGIARYTPSTGEFTPIPDALLPTASAVYSMCHDRATDCLWLGTDNGLVQYDVATGARRWFDDSDGFQGQVYYPLSAFMSASGKMYLGGTNGFSILDPGSIRQNPRKPQARISAFYIDNEPVSPSMWKTREGIELSHDQANFGFRLSSDNYQTPEKNRFRYRLRGYDDDWITADASDRTVMYAKVPPGKYQFEVLAANNDGVWSDVPARVSIIRHPAPWASPVAYGVYALLLILIAWAVYHYWNEKRKLKLRLFLDAVDKQKKDELHKSQLRFFTNISHDFRTPISLILAAIDNMKQDGMKDYYYRILHNNSRRLLNLVNELMDFRTLDNNKMKLHVEALDANALVMSLASDFDDYARKRNIRFEIDCDPALTDEQYVDKQVLEKVVMNLLNNAFKYTPDGGEITIATYSAASKFAPRYRHSHIIPAEQTTGSEFVIAVRDSGCGISADSITHVFDRYYQVNTNNLNHHLGTGIGLALVKSLVMLHHGSISIFSERNDGTDIVVALPSSASAYSPDEFATADTTSSCGEQRRQPDGADIIPATADSDASSADPGPGPDDGGPVVRKRILLVEDNDDLRTLIAGFLKLHYDIAEASDGVEALKKLDDTTADLIISDIMMPNMDGIALCRAVKENIDTSHIPVMLLTARTGVDDRIEGADAGADLYFSKPIDFNLLLQSVRNVFKHQQNLRDHYSRNYYADKAELTSNRQDSEFLTKITEVIDAHLEGDNLDVNLIANELCMSRSKLYTKLKALTGKSIVEFVLNYRMRKAAKIIVEQDMPLYQVMEQVGIRSQSHFVNSFKKEFGETPSSFMARHRRNSQQLIKLGISSEELGVRSAGLPYGVSAVTAVDRPPTQR